MRALQVNKPLARLRGSHFWLTPKAGGGVDRQHPTRVNRALREPGIEMIPACSPQARGRSERSFGTWQGRLPQELRLAGITQVTEANRFLRDSYIATFNREFAHPAEQKGTAFLPLKGRNLDRIFSLRHERVVNRDNTVTLGKLVLQIEPVRWRATLAGCRVVVRQHLNGQVSLAYGPHELGRFSDQGLPLRPLRRKPLASAPQRGRAAMAALPRSPSSLSSGAAAASGSGWPATNSLAFKSGQPDVLPTYPVLVFVKPL